MTEKTLPQMAYTVPCEYPVQLVPQRELDISWSLPLLMLFAVTAASNELHQ